MMNSNKVRYLIFFQYIGTKYCGVMRAPTTQAILGVENYLQMAAQKLRPMGNVTFSISSRTDSGVHALCNSAHVDIERASGKAPFSADVLANGLNFHLNTEPIRDLDMPRIQEAAELLLGTHDFSAFRSIDKAAPFKSPIKTLQQVDVTPSTSLLPNHQCRDLQFWDFTFKSKSFAYKQVRRMTSALVAVGLGLLTPQQISLHLETREAPVFPGRLIAPPCGLFLKEVEYSELDLKTDKTELGKCTSGNT
ncbi:tRNA pseudouridine synthase-like 1 isoform X3 [Mixophyes fleayi]|uniref:tRNA pseudouridine synthase-like 1 isoform X3 n=1 Tax=Mixophyes fleayi TaxID=3061075 RepID=UPI003F4D9F49